LYLQAHLTSKQETESSWPQWLLDFLDKLSSPNVFNLPLSHIYSLSSYSQTRLNTLFKQYTGTSLIQYITKQKIHYACNLLNSTNYKISHIYSLAGFSSISGFNHAFKKIMGMTPSEYKNKYITTQAH
jgi:AraC-like DNA-binding protein